MILSLRTNPDDCLDSTVGLDDVSLSVFIRIVISKNC